MRMRQLFSGVVAACLLVLLALFIDFKQRTYSDLNIQKPPLVGVVFTGQYSRVDAGLNFLENGVINRLIISGVNGGAGLSTQTFANQFLYTPELKKRFAAGDIVLGTRANITLENALETACLLSEAAVYGDDGTVLLVTSRTHMPRASLLLETVSPDRQVLRWIVTDADDTWHQEVTEFKKYLLARGLVLLRWVPGIWQKQACGVADGL